MQSSWVLGACLNGLGSVSINLGTNMLKLGHQKRVAMEEASGRKLLVRTFPEWQVGVVLFGVGNALNFVSFGFAAQSLLAALGSVQFLSNVVFARLVLGEQVGRSVLAATGCIVAGCVLLVTFGNHESAVLAAADLLRFYHNPVYWAYLGALAGTGLLAFALYRRGQQAVAESRRGAGGGEALPLAWWPRLLPLCFAAHSGLLGTQSVVFAKSLAVLLRASWHEPWQPPSAFFLANLCGFATTAAFWVQRLNRAVRLFPSLVIVPVMQLNWTLFSMLSGGLFFQEYRDVAPRQALLFALGALVVLYGVYWLAGASPGQQPYLRQLEGPAVGSPWQEVEEGLAGLSPRSKAARSASGGPWERLTPPGALADVEGTRLRAGDAERPRYRPASPQAWADDAELDRR